MARFFLALLLLLPLATPVRAADSAVEMQLRYLEKDLERLEADITRLREEVKAAEKSAEKKVEDRVGDLSLILADGANKISVSSYLATWASVLITLSLFVVTAFTALRVPEQAKEAAREKAEEISNKAVERAEKEASRLAREAVINVKSEASKVAEKISQNWISDHAEPRIKKLENYALNQMKNNNNRIKPNIDKINSRIDSLIIEKEDDFTFKESKNIDNIIKEQDAVDYIQSLSPSDRTADQWRALTKHFIDQGSYEAALPLCDEWLKQPNQTSDDTALALMRRGYCLARLTPPQWEDALTAWEEVIKRFKDDPTPSLCERVTKAFFNKGLVFTLMKQPIDARATYEDYLRRFANASEPAIQEITTQVRTRLAALK